MSPSWGGAALFPHRVAAGVRQLETLGFRVRFGKHALNSSGCVSDTAEHRAADLHELFRDPGVRAVLASIGGDHSCHLLPLLDFDLIRSHPKILVGFSDITVLNVAIWKETGLTTFNGPALLTDFAEYPAMFEYTRDHFLRTLCQPEPPGRIEPSPWWTEEFLDWGLQEHRQRSRTRHPSPGWSWLRDGAAEGILIGGCLESLQHLRGTRYWPDWQDAILFIETSEEAPSVEKVDGILMDYENMGVFASLRALIVGRPMRYSEEDKAALRRVLLERTARYGFPIVADMDFGHTAPQMVLPIGCRARIDSQRQSFEIIEAAVA